jgi:hypothetical protein
MNSPSQLESHTAEKARKQASEIGAIEVSQFDLRSGSELDEIRIKTIGKYLGH